MDTELAELPLRRKTETELQPLYGSTRPASARSLSLDVLSYHIMTLTA